MGDLSLKQQDVPQPTQDMEKIQAIYGVISICIDGLVVFFQSYFYMIIDLHNFAPTFKMV